MIIPSLAVPQVDLLNSLFSLQNTTNPENVESIEVTSEDGENKENLFSSLLTTAINSEEVQETQVQGKKENKEEKENVVENGDVKKQETLPEPILPFFTPVVEAKVPEKLVKNEGEGKKEKVEKIQAYLKNTPAPINLNMNGNIPLPKMEKLVKLEEENKEIPQKNKILPEMLEKANKTEIKRPALTPTRIPPEFQALGENKVNTLVPLKVTGGKKLPDEKIELFVPTPAPVKSSSRDSIAAMEPLTPPIIPKEIFQLEKTNLTIPTISSNPAVPEIKVGTAPNMEIIQQATNYIIQNKANIQADKPLEVIVQQSPLGRVKFSVEKNKDNEIKVAIQTTNPSANAFLVENKEKIVQNLDTQGIKIKDFQVKMNAIDKFEFADNKQSIQFVEKQTQSFQTTSNATTQNPSSVMTSAQSTQSAQVAQSVPSQNFPNLSSSLGKTDNQSMNSSSFGSSSTSKANESQTVDPTTTQSPSNPQGFYEQARRDSQRRAQLWQYAKNRGY